jgi:DNA modification methylase
MTPHYADDWLTVYAGDNRAILPTLPAESVHCVITSPPYWGLRDYGTEGQLGLEPTPEQYVENMVAVFREVKRVLRNDGTLWLNLGDSYATPKQGSTQGTSTSGLNNARQWREDRNPVMGVSIDKKLPPGLKPKDLVGIPWRVAFALQADGWYLRSDIIWSKPNPMPESVTDRPTKSHEYLFLLTKSERYYFDQEAVREANAEPKSNGGWQSAARNGRSVEYDQRYARNKTVGAAGGSKMVHGGHDLNAGRNIRSVWTVATQPYPGAHFATFPPKLIEPCIKAGTSERGVCPECGAPWRRVVGDRPYPKDLANAAKAHGGIGNNLGGQRHQGWLDANPRQMLGWQPSCAHDAEPIPATLLDPFAGSGTVGTVAQSLSRRAVLIDLNPDYIEQQLKRNAQTPLGLTA